MYDWVRPYLSEAKTAENTLQKTALAAGLRPCYRVGQENIRKGGRTNAHNQLGIPPADRRPTPERRTMQDIIDVSRYQGTIDWDKLAGKIGGAMLKTVSTNKSFGGIYIDPVFERNYSECKRLGIPVGVYYYTYAQDAAAARAELDKLKEALTGKNFELPVAVDVEDNKLKPLPADALTDLVIQAADTIESWGLYAMVYTYTHYSQTELNMDWLNPYDLWIADYRSQRPSRKHGMWQYTSTGKMDGIAGNVDISHAYKDYPSIIARAGLTTLRG